MMSERAQSDDLGGAAEQGVASSEYRGRFLPIIRKRDLPHEITKHYAKKGTAKRSIVSRLTVKEQAENAKFDRTMEQMGKERQNKANGRPGIKKKAPLPALSKGIAQKGSIKQFHETSTREGKVRMWEPAKMWTTAKAVVSFDLDDDHTEATKNRESQAKNKKKIIRRMVKAIERGNEWSNVSFLATVASPKRKVLGKEDPMTQWLDCSNRILRRKRAGK